MGSEALAYALRLLARKGYSRAVLRAKLAARFGEAEAEAALGRLEAMGYQIGRASCRERV